MQARSQEFRSWRGNQQLEERHQQLNGGVQTVVGGVQCKYPVTYILSGIYTNDGVTADDGGGGCVCGEGRRGE